MRPMFEELTKLSVQLLVRHRCGEGCINGDILTIRQKECDKKTCCQINFWWNRPDILVRRSCDNRI